MVWGIIVRGGGDADNTLNTRGGGYGGRLLNSTD